MKKPATKFLRWLYLQWQMLVIVFQDFMRRVQHEVAQQRALASVNEDTHIDARKAMMKVYRERMFPPDCLSAGMCRGGHALYFKHDEAMEIFIGKSYDHAADKLIEWFREEQAAQVTPITKASTQMNRAERRKWLSGRW